MSKWVIPLAIAIITIALYVIYQILLGIWVT